MRQDRILALMRQVQREGVLAEQGLERGLQGYSFHEMKPEAATLAEQGTHPVEQAVTLAVSEALQRQNLHLSQLLALHASDQHVH